MTNTVEDVVLLDIDENIDQMTRKELQKRCKTYGIRSNMKTNEMRYSLKCLSEGKTLPTSYYTQKWLSKHQNAKYIKKGGIGLIGIIAIAIFIFIIVKSFGSGNISVNNNITNTTHTPI